MKYDPFTRKYSAMWCNRNNYGVAGDSVAGTTLQAKFGLAPQPCRSCPINMVANVPDPTNAVAEYYHDKDGAPGGDGGFTSPLACVTKPGFGECWTASARWPGSGCWSATVLCGRHSVVSHQVQLNACIVGNLLCCCTLGVEGCHSYQRCTFTWCMSVGMHSSVIVMSTMHRCTDTRLREHLKHRTIRHAKRPAKKPCPASQKKTLGMGIAGKIAQIPVSQLTEGDDSHMPLAVAMAATAAVCAGCCLAAAGYDGRISYKCPKGSYSPGNNRTACIQCVPGKTTADNATLQVQESDCGLASGFGFHDGAIVVCPIGQLC
jgi:hypothetical protein